MRYRCLWSREPDFRGTHQIVAATVGQQHRALFDRGPQILSALLAYMPLDLEDISEIGGEREFERHLRIEIAEVCKSQSLIQPTLPQKAAALDMNDTLGNRALAQGRQGPVRQMGREERVVVADRRTQERGPQPSDLKFEP